MAAEPNVPPRHDAREKCIEDVDLELKKYEAKAFTKSLNMSDDDIKHTTEG